jgi:hypothetical protein
VLQPSPRATIQPVSATRKPVIVRKLTRDWSAGYAAANPAAESELELLDTRGRILRVDWNQIKWVCYVRELGGAEGPAEQQPERLLRHHFTSRPRSAGLWLRLVLDDGDELEGIAANDRTLMEGAGLLLTPPDTRSNTQRVFVPRSTIRELTILGVIAPKSRDDQRHDAQPELFAIDPTPETELL